jgi:hypothetical protein
VSYALGRAYTAVQADDLLGWTPARRKAYWDARAKACSEFGDEGECLAQVAKHVPVTIGGLGDTAADVSTALTVTAGLFRDPDGTLRRYGPPIVTAADQHVVNPLIDRIGQSLTPYVLKYVLPVIAGLYVTTGISAYYSYKAYDQKRVRANRRGRRKRRTSRRR